MDWIMDYLTWSNFFYLAGLILAGLVTLISKKYRKIMVEVGEVVKALEVAYKDGKLSKSEKEKIMKEMLDVLKAVINLKWKLWK
jgi:hypothetical protein|tara:strand:- start:3396 stop:3647 length:252 start_codon:yes stop_codon:yes gene_type:complete